MALAIIAVALGAAVKAVAGHAAAQDRIEEKMLAHWVAMNRLAEVLTGGLGTAAGGAEGVDPMGRRNWHWHVSYEATGDPAIHRVLVTVAHEGSGQEIDRVASYQRQVLQ